MIAVKAEDVKGSTLLGIVQERVMPSSTIFTDEYKSYDGIRFMGKATSTSGFTTRLTSIGWERFTPTRLKDSGA